MSKLLTWLVALALALPAGQELRLCGCGEGFLTHAPGACALEQEDPCCARAAQPHGGIAAVQQGDCCCTWRTLETPERGAVQLRACAAELAVAPPALALETSPIASDRRSLRPPTIRGRSPPGERGRLPLRI